ncbi:MAG: exodeoxyribonuclease VII small subunit [Clostridiales bacterium]|nr:exodeoxyribonuclease VII small subunit [Clostridiales bacterium]
MTVKKGKQEPTFEEELTRLEALAEQMETGDLPLDQLMDTYEEGTRIAKALQERLEQAKARLSEVKTRKDGSVSVTASPIATQGSLLDELEP